MNYEKIVNRIRGEGLEEFDQGEEAVRERIEIGNGVCRALVVTWLRAKRDDVDFWEGRGTIRERLLAGSDRLQQAVDLQAEYARANQSRFLPDPATMVELQKSHLTYDQEDVRASGQQGFTQELPNDEPAKIARQVLTAGSRFFILSIKGDSGAHSIGIHRPFALVRKSSDAYLFDPNTGEFKVTGQQDLKTLLVVLNSVGYEGMDLNKSYVLWSYTA